MSNVPTEFRTVLMMNLRRHLASVQRYLLDWKVVVVDELNLEFVVVGERRL